MHRADHILVADDDADFVLLLRTAFEYAGFNGSFKVASDGLQAIQYLKGEGFDARNAEFRPCLIMLDLALPRLSGAEALGWIRQQPAMAELPVILMSGIEAGTEAQLAAELGANEWVVKPFGFGKLVELTERLCARWLASEDLLGARPR